MSVVNSSKRTQPTSMHMHDQLENVPVLVSWSKNPEFGSGGDADRIPHPPTTLPPLTTHALRLVLRANDGWQPKRRSSASVDVHGGQSIAGTAGHPSDYSAIA